MKSWFASKTIIVNALTLAASLLSVAGGSELIQQYPRASAAIVAALATVNILIRFVTAVPIG
jgi:hypothetical protein